MTRAAPFDDPVTLERTTPHVLQVRFPIDFRSSNVSYVSHRAKGRTCLAFSHVPCLFSSFLSRHSSLAETRATRKTGYTLPTLSRGPGPCHANRPGAVACTHLHPVTQSRAFLPCHAKNVDGYCGEQGCRDACIFTLSRTLPCHAFN